MYELMELSGREYVDVYAQRVKAQLAKGRPTRQAEEKAPAIAA
jgi:hypothetical protein